MSVRFTMLGQKHCFDYPHGRLSRPSRTAGSQLRTHTNFPNVRTNNGQSQTTGMNLFVLYEYVGYVFHSCTINIVWFISRLPARFRRGSSTGMIIVLYGMSRRAPPVGQTYIDAGCPGRWKITSCRGGTTPNNHCCTRSQRTLRPQPILLEYKQYVRYLAPPCRDVHNPHLQSTAHEERPLVTPSLFERNVKHSTAGSQPPPCHDPIPAPIESQVRASTPGALVGAVVYYVSTETTVVSCRSLIVGLRCVLAIFGKHPMCRSPCA